MIAFSRSWQLAKEQLEMRLLREETRQLKVEKKFYKSIKRRQSCLSREPAFIALHKQASPYTG